MICSQNLRFCDSGHLRELPDVVPVRRIPAYRWQRPPAQLEFFREIGRQLRNLSDRFECARRAQHPEHTTFKTHIIHLWTIVQSWTAFLFGFVTMRNTLNVTLG